jgi:hypothetical protein
MKPIFAMVNCSYVFYALLPALHAIGALIAVSLSFACDTGKGRQTARIPVLLRSDMATNQNFLAAYPWDEGGAFTDYDWNPFALIFVFEWLTAAFALRTLKYFVSRPELLLQVWFAWLLAGLTVFIAWSLTNSGGICVAMFIVVLVSFVVCAALGYFSLFMLDITFNATGSDMKSRPNKGSLFRDHMGRVWNVPRIMSKLRYSQVAVDGEDDRGQTGDLTEGQKAFENLFGVAMRYAEYCVTAPLLFLAVVCLMVTDAPAWLFLTGYWLLIVCNALGIALHLSFSSRQESRGVHDRGGLAGWALHMFFSTPW